MNAPKVCRSGDRCVVSSFGELIYCVVHHSELPPKAIADALGMRVGYLLDSANYDREDTQFQGRKFLPLLRVTNRWDAMETLAGMAGGVFFQVPSVTTDSQDVVEQSSKLLREFSDVLAVAAKAADGVSASEAGAVAREGREAIREISRLVQLMELKSGTPAATRAPLQVVSRG